MFTKIKAVRVQELILSGSSDRIGSIRYNDINDGKPIDTNSLRIARPLHSNISHYPVVNEIVYLVAGPKEDYNFSAGIRHYYLPPLNIYNSVNHNAQPNELTLDEIANKSEVGLNSFFKSNARIKPLQPYDGDINIEGRYGNSIRFGSTKSGSHPNNWSNEGSNFNPITIIRNGQSGSENPTQNPYILEDINHDDSSIYLCSNQQITNFQKSGIEIKHIELSYKHML
tara:strand:- start:8 stop:688 length:681 start_codon:yes stop_codon:yes gene_type:complete